MFTLDHPFPISRGFFSREEKQRVDRLGGRCQSTVLVVEPNKDVISRSWSSSRLSSLGSYGAGFQDFSLQGGVWMSHLRVN